jgi:hypothetical protein
VTLFVLAKADPTPEGVKAAKAYLDLVNRLDGRPMSRDERKLAKRYTDQVAAANEVAAARYESQQATGRVDALRGLGLLPDGK